ncbi:hypothetical protein [Rhodovulum visakhapatnamense]|uniref:Uncharacterized protein n=1 Tax=Rhodovulum visakhapatnamense TaxID=364297 RepID=A0A4R8FZN9_9RHOB|nr:hypothetical protein [Rhodovulum visakhapatnamense]TDX32631.1 hypothetical protein EV657_103203 [Rhodovulum visakhapatnamense]
MSYVHLHVFTRPGAGFRVVDIILVDTFGRSSVPLLSTLSGYFMVSFFAKRSYVAAALVRARAASADGDLEPCRLCPARLHLSPRDALLAATDQSKLVYPSFLRDLFVMSPLTPLLVLGFRKAPWIVGAVILA